MFNCFNLAARKQICVYKNMENLENPYTTMSRETNFQKFAKDPPNQYEQATGSISYKAKNVPEKKSSNKETTSFLKPFRVRTKCWITFLVAWLVVVTILLVLLCLYVFINLKGQLESRRVDAEVKPKNDSDCKANLELYHIGDTKMSWQEAQTYCRSIGGNLTAYGMRVASIRKEIIDELIKPSGVGDYWIGLTDIDSETYFVYVDGVWAGYENTNFHVTQPNNSGGDEDCVHLWGDRDFLMNDTPCSREAFPVCEFPC